MVELTLRRLTKRYHDLPVVAGIDLVVASGEFVSLLGPSGCGKTTVLRMVAGLITPTSGAVLIDGADVTSLPPHRRRLGLVFQSYALFPHLSVFDNVAFGLRRQGLRGDALKRRVGETLELVRLGHVAARLPRQLSGGQQQRVALARAVAPRPQILLLDEPLSNLDALLRDEMQIEIKRLQRELVITSLFVTHDQSEALSLSDRVCVLNDGLVQQVGAPEEIYHTPANGFVAGFIGRSNRLRASIEAADAGGAQLRLSDGTLLRSASRGLAVGASVDVIIRHHAIRLEAVSAQGDGIDGDVVLRSFSGAQVQRVVRLQGGVELVSECSTGSPEAAFGVGERVRVLIDPQSVFVAPLAQAG
jgi:putative spermidine/putrescine transport system ATP-binding protein